MSQPSVKTLSPPDPILTGCLVSLLSLSILMVYSTSISVAEVRYGNPFRIIGHWLIYIPIGLGMMWLVSRIDVNWWRASALPLLGLGLMMMVAVLIPGLGREINGAQRWFSLLGMTLQPIELLKPTVIIYMAYYMSSYPERLKSFVSGLAPMLVVLIVSLGLLLLQPDFGSSVLLATVCFAMWFIGGVPMRHMCLLIASFIPLAGFAIVAAPYRMQRLTSFLDPWQDPYGTGYQLIQSMIAFGSGGLFGTGVGQGVQKLFYLPEVFTDFISASIGEELGLVGILSILIVFSVLIGRAIWLAIRSEDMFSRLLIMGSVVMIGTALMINLGAAMGLLPTKGMPMPFVSYGGSALFGECILLGLIFSVQRHMPGNKRHHRVDSGKKAKSSVRPQSKANAKTSAKTNAQPIMDKELEHLF